MPPFPSASLTNVSLLDIPSYKLGTKLRKLIVVAPSRIRTLLDVMVCDCRKNGVRCRWRIPAATHREI